MEQDVHRLVALQTAPAFGEVESNLAAVDEALRDVRCDLLVLPELFATGYSFVDRAELESLAEPADGGPTAARLKAWSEQTDALIVAGFPERDGARVYNAAAIVRGGKVAGCYRKLHLFGFEREVFDPGDLPLTVHEHRGLRVGPMVCFDWIFPEVTRTLALRGADVIAHPSNLVLPGLCQQAMVVRAIENRVFTVTANRFGEEHRVPRPRLVFTGASRVVDPTGAVLAEGPAEGAQRLEAEARTVLSRDKRVASGNDILAERRPAFYAASAAEAHPRASGSESSSTPAS